jgi:Uma2 family endonuclease
MSADPTVVLVAPARHLPLRLRPEAPLDDAALLELCALNRDLRIERAADGDLILEPPTGGDTGARNSAINFQLQQWNRATGAGRVFDSSTGFLLANGAERAPDAAWVRRDRWEALSPAERRGFPPLCPDLVLELRSPSDRIDDLHGKLREYLANGAQVGLLVDPDARVVWIYRPGGTVERHDAPEHVEIGPVMPGFALYTAEIFS